jgi:hypothetical protein
MASPKQIAANKANALKSTGPGDEAKQRTRLNAKRHGLTGQIATLSDEDRPFFEKRRAGFLADFAPANAIELELVEAIALDTWRLDHLRAVEKNMYALAREQSAPGEGEDPQFHACLTDAHTFVGDAKEFALLSLYEQRMNRNLHRNLTALRAMQAERKRIYERELSIEVLLARSCDINGLTYQVSDPSLTNGIVFSSAQVLAAANRASRLELAKKTLASAPLMVQFASQARNSNSCPPHHPVNVAKAA